MRFKLAFVSLAVFVFVIPTPIFAVEEETTWTVYPEERHEIHIPNIPGYETLKCDFHIHTVFSDGLVWPTVRVEEAWREGLDVIAFTDHIEYQPHKKDVPIQFERPFDIGAVLAWSRNIEPIKGAEITHDTPPGHFNALFLETITSLDIKEVTKAVRAAAKQEGFVFWNHPGWKGPERGKWSDVQTELYNNHSLRGIEICNGDDYYKEAHQWALEKNLTLLGNSDLHAPASDRPYTPEIHRTLTLVFAKEKTTPALKEALLAGRTAVWCKNNLYGKQEFLDAIFRASVRVERPHYHSKNSWWLEIKNDCDLDLHLERNGEQGPKSLTLPANAVILVEVDFEKEPEKPVTLSYRVKNFIIAPDTSSPVNLTIELTQGNQAVR